MGYSLNVYHVHAEFLAKGKRASPRHLNVFTVECLKAAETVCLSLFNAGENYLAPSVPPDHISKEQIKIIYSSVLGFLGIMLNGQALPGEWRERVRIISAVAGQEYLEVMSEDLPDGNAELMEQLFARCTFMLYSTLGEPRDFDAQIAGELLMDSVRSVATSVT